MVRPIVFFDIAGPDDAGLDDFYASIFGWEPDQSGQLSIPVNSPINGVIRQDPTEKRIYIGVSDVTATLSQIVESSGSIVAPRFEVAGVVVL